MTVLVESYTYDESGNRIIVTNPSRTTYYVYDATGNVLAIYYSTTPTNPTLQEVPIYGTGRLGTYFTTGSSYVYEIRDNVGSVRVAFAGSKTTGGLASVYSYNDYYPFGAPLPGGGGTQYRYQYQGAYAEDDQNTEYNNFELRMYDARIGRWLSTDPAGQFDSPYEGMGNDPIIGSDPTGAIDSIFNDVVTGITTRVTTKDDFDVYLTGTWDTDGYGKGAFETSSERYVYKPWMDAGYNNGVNDPSNDVNRTSLGHNLFWTNYIGPWNPKSYNGKWSYAPNPVNRADFYARNHDRAYDRLKISGAGGLFFSTKSIGADYTLVGHELALCLNPVNGATGVERIEGLIVGEGIAAFALPKTIFNYVNSVVP